MGRPSRSAFVEAQCRDGSQQFSSQPILAGSLNSGQEFEAGDSRGEERAPRQFLGDKRGSRLGASEKINACVRIRGDHRQDYRIAEHSRQSGSVSLPGKAPRKRSAGRSRRCFSAMP